MTFYEKFRKRFPPKFHGLEEPMVVNDFIEQLKQLFAVFRCTQKQKVSLLAYMFQGIALQWWNLVKAAIQANIVTEEDAWMSSLKNLWISLFLSTARISGKRISKI